MKKIIYQVLGPCLLAITFILLFNSNGIANAGSASINDLKVDPEQSGPPWFDPAWHYRRGVAISSEAGLTYYQVMIRLDMNNFDFSRARTNGQDIRFTHSDGTTELKYWIESWDSTNRLAYLWVRVPSLADGETTIYIYYGNPAAQSTSDGVATFDAFDDNWDQFLGSAEKPGLLTTGSAGPSSPFAWAVIGETPTVVDGTLSLGDGSGIKSTASFQYQAVGMRANYGLNSVDEWIGFINGIAGSRTLIGDMKPGNLNDLFVIDTANGSDFEYNVLTKIDVPNWHGAFHLYELRWKSGQSMGDIDHGKSIATSTLPAMVPGIPLPVGMYNDTQSVSSLLVDWIYVRQYYDPEPTASVKNEQALVELSLGISDSPDPVGKGSTLTYQLTISNDGSINAPGVVLTDTLPANVQLLSVEPTQGTCEPGTIILCDLNLINANGQARVTVVVSATMEGHLTNLAAIGSPGFELDLSDNYAEEDTLVDWTPPVVNWEQPAKNGGTSITFGGLVTLEASATDAGGIGWVEFKLWDHINNQWISLGKGYSYPYQVQFDPSILAVNDLYQMFVLAVDRAGNASNPYDPLQRIFIERRLSVFLPLMRK